MAEIWLEKLMKTDLTSLAEQEDFTTNGLKWPKKIKAWTRRPAA